MSLQEYKKKRDFKKTPEPEGKEEATSGPLRFVIQKHAATRLHYDFRLEMGGVMKSWAVPKGPSLNPEDKRLAMETEDHPISYNQFEGIIPKGEYGGGTVMIWDEGFYAPVGITNIDESNSTALSAYHKGEIKFAIQGKKVKGEFVLVKTKGRQENAWLLIKHKDKFASEKDITEQDKSVKTGRKLDEITNGAKEKGEVWISKNEEIQNLPKINIPDVIEPMLATLIDKPFDDPDFLFEIKWDGYRTIAKVGNGSVELLSRNNISFDEMFAPIKKSLENLKQEMVLDGEVVILDKEGRSDFGLLQNYKRTKKGTLVYYVFDLLFFDNKDLRALPLVERKKLLAEIIKGLPENIKLSEGISEKGIAFFDAARTHQIEGIVGKRKDSVYESGRRSPNWVKIKTSLRQEAVVGGYTLPRGSRKFIGALVLGVYDDKGDFIYIGHSGGGISGAELKELKKKLDEIAVEKTPFKTEPKTNMPATWVQPKIVVEMDFTGWTSEGLMRHPRYLGTRVDKNPKEIKLEKPTAPKTVIQKVSTKDEEIRTYDDKAVTLRNLSKKYWPKEGYTKKDMVEYYEKIADVMLPYLIDRPESLHRYPEGIEGKNRFWQKDIDYKPAWAKTIKLHSDSEDKDIDYFLCQDKASLVYLANLGCIEINPWFSRVGSLDNPDYVAIDLDPEDIGFPKVVEVANVVRGVLEETDIKGFPKTSGATGIHIYIPLNGKYDYDQGKQFAEIIARIVHDKLPAITSVERSPSKRQKKVYVDYLQNRSGQTLAAPYSLRPKPGATVSTPLKWEELNDKLRVEDFDIKTIFTRLDRVGDLWKGVPQEQNDIAKSLKKLVEEFDKKTD